MVPLPQDKFDVVYLTSEIFPFSKTGGLADVMGALPPAVADKGVSTAVITPYYGQLKTSDFQLRLVAADCHVGYPWPPTGCDVYEAVYEGVTIFFIQRDEYFDRKHYYNTYKGDYFDNCERFNFFCRAALQWIKRLGYAPQIVHSNDWQSALVSTWIHYLRQHDSFWSQTKTVITIHNLAFQGRFSSRLFFESGLPGDAWNMEGCEFFGDFNLLKSGIAYSDAITTVSPSYAEEIVTAEFGCGLEGILGKRADRLYGILNGAGYDVWDPRQDKFLPCCYSPERPGGKQWCKKKLLREFYLSDMLEDKPVLGFIGRLRSQKGIDMLIEILPELMKHDLGVIVLGEGNLQHESKLLDMMEQYHGQLAVEVDYTEELAHRIQAGCDIFLMPSRYEPCGLTQMYSLRYGTPPVATAVGGLKDTIRPYPREDATGFIFDKPQSDLFYNAIMEAVDCWWKKDEWAGLVRRAMSQDFSWESSAERYLDVYRSLGAEL